MSSYLKSAMVVSLSTLLSRILGMVRDIVLASAFGASHVLDAFLLAFTIPNLFRRIFGEGALSAAMIPVFTETLEHQGSQFAFSLVNKVLTMMLWVLGGISALGVLLCLGAYYSGYLGEKDRLAAGFLAVMMPYLLLICVAAVMGAILNTLHHFLLPALAPAVFNAIWLVGLCVLSPLLGNTPVAWAYGMAISIIIGGVVQVVMQWPSLKSRGLSFAPAWDTQDTGIQKIGASMGPVILGTVVLQVNVLVDRLLAWWMIPSTGALTVLYMGDRLMQFPLALIGISMATVVFPLFARHATRGEHDQLAQAIPKALRITFFGALPATVGLWILAWPTVSLIYGHNRFTPDDTMRTAHVVMAYAGGLWTAILVQILARAFYALQDTLTPMRVATWCVTGSLILKLILVAFFRETGLAAATSVGSILQMMVLIHLLRRKVRLDWQGLPGFLAKTCLAGSVMGIGVWASAFLIPYPGHLGGRLAQTLLPLFLGVVIYFAGALLLRVPELEYFKGHSRKTPV